MKKNTLAKFLCGAALCMSVSAASLHALTVRVTVENQSPTGGLWFTPTFLGFHDGSFDFFDSGSAASAAVEAIAETGDASGLVSSISNTPGAVSHVLTRSGTMPPDVLFAPGTSNYVEIDLDSTYNRFLSFASMLIPSNDAFFGNDDAMAYEIFDGSGGINPLSIDIYGADIWDSGTELNDTMGAPFSLIGGNSTSTSDNISAHAGLDNFVGTALPIGEDLQSAYTQDQLLASITVEQVPDHASFIGLIGAIGLIGMRVIARRRESQAA